MIDQFPSVFFQDKSHKLFLILILALQVSSVFVSHSHSTTGSITVITFTTTLSPVSSNDCPSFFVLSDAGDLGTGALCHLDAGTTQMTIYYGADLNPGPITLNFRMSGFTLATTGFEIFRRPTIPNFGLNEGSVNDYQNTSKTVYLIDIETNSATDLEYTWTYIQGGPTPNIGGNLTTFTFKFWEINPAIYEINITVTDPSNANYRFSKRTAVFEVKNSCTNNNCHIITWKLSGTPLNCPYDCPPAADCIEGEGITDQFMLNTGGNIINAYYQAGSHGGTSLLNLEPTTFGNQVSCPGIELPWLSVNNDAPVCQSSFNTLTLTANVYDGGKVLGTDYTLTWVQPSGHTACLSGQDSCDIIYPGGGLGAGGTYIYDFKLKLTLTCASAAAWSTAVFTPFRYAPYFTVNSNTGYIGLVINILYWVKTTGTTKEHKYNKIISF